MAYLQEDDEDQAQGLNQVLTQPNAPQATTPEETQPQQTSGGSSQVGNTQPNTTPTPAARNTTPSQVNQKAGSGMFTNLRKYLTANEGNRIAGAATQKVANLATGAQKGIQHASTAFGQQVERGTLANRGQAVQDVQKTVGAARQVVAQPQQPQSALATPPNTPASAPPAEIPVAPVVEAAQAAQVQAATATPVVPAQPVPQAPAPEVQQPKYIDDEQAKRFADIINARYQGPESIRQAGLLTPAQTKVQEAARQMKNTQTAMGREELLRSMFGRNRDYTQGQSKLDALLLNTSSEGVGQLQDAAKKGQGITQQLQTAENVSQNLATNRAAEIAGIRGQARDIFQTGRTEEEVATEKRIDDLIKTPVMDENGQPMLKLDGTPMTEWDRLPEHFRQSLKNKAAGAKSAQQEMISQAEVGAAGQKQQLTQAQQKVANLSDQIRKAQNQWGIGEAGKAFGDSNSQDYQKSLVSQANLKNNISQMQQQLAEAQRVAQTAQNSPEYKQYQDQLAAAKNMNMNQWILSPEEAAILGVSAGEGLYNTRADDIKTTQADRERIISQDEFARQQALSQLAGLDLSKGLQKELKYQDAGKAGTQTLQDSLDTEAFRNQLDEAQRLFEESAKGANITGSGMKKVSRGNAFGKKTKKYYATVGGNAADMLRQAGYDINKEGPSEARSILGDQDMMQKLFAARGNPLENQPVATNQQALSNYRGATDTTQDEEGTVGYNSTEGAAIGASIGAYGGPVASAIGAGLGAMAGGNTLDPLQADTGMLSELEDKYGLKGLGGIGKSIEGVRSDIGKFVSPVLGKGIGGMIGGIDTGAMKAYGSAKAKQIAIKDLQNKYKRYLEGQGFENRTNIADTEGTRARSEALRQLLSRRG